MPPVFSYMILLKFCYAELYCDISYEIEFPLPYL